MHQLIKTAMWALFVVAGIFALLTVAVLIMMVADFQWRLLAALVIGLILTIAAGGTAIAIADSDKEMTSRYDMEQALLDKEQKAELKRTRAKALFEKGMLEAQSENDQIQRLQIERSRRSLEED